MPKHLALLDGLQDPTWRKLVAQLPEGLLSGLQKQLDQAQGQEIYPPRSRLWAALNLTPWEQVRLVILGQDPYHQPGQATGLAFAVPQGCPIPPSLRNILKELQASTGKQPASTNLEGWARQGVLLLNASLTVARGQANSHASWGWPQLTQALIQSLNQKSEPVIFFLWGKDAQAKKEVIHSRHLVLEAPHPSPLSAYRGFLGSGHFKKAEAAWQDWGQAPVDWSQ